MKCTFKYIGRGSIVHVAWLTPILIEQAKHQKAKVK